MSLLENKSDSENLEKLLSEIEKKLAWGQAQNWKTSDFEQLSENISAVSDVKLSVTTLKRLWGKVAYSSVPNRSTLDALAIFSGAKDWRDYIAVKNKERLIPTNKSEVEKSKNLKISSREKRFGVYLLALFVLGFGLIYWILNQDSTVVDFHSEDFKLSVKKTAEGLPNSVIFTYDATAAPADAVIEIQQNWDEERRQIVEREDSVASSLYYTPGYFKAKLVVDDKIVQEEDVFISTQNWLGVLHTEPVPRYFSNEEVTIPEGVGINLASLKEVDIKKTEKSALFSLFKVTGFEKTRIDNFILETEIQNLSDPKTSPCNHSKIVLFCAGEAIVIPLSVPGCVAENRVIVLDKSFSGSNTDLSAFGVDFSKPVKLKCIGKNQELNIYLNNNLIFTTPLMADNRLIGLRFDFAEAGVVKKLRVQDTAEVGH